MRIAFLSPQLPPSVNGVGDHTVQLAQAMCNQASGVSAIYLDGSVPSPSAPFERVDRWNRRSADLATLVKDHRADCLWVQYSGYGYGYQGIPQYLVRSLRRLGGSVAIVIFFHETHCSIAQLGWKGYLLSPMQRWIGRCIAQYADVVLTSCELYCDLIRREYGVSDHKLSKLPIGSNIPISIVTAHERQRLRQSFGWDSAETVAVAFGSVGSQRIAIRRNQAALIQAVRSQQIQRIVCIGGATAAPTADFIDLCDCVLRQRITVMGHQDMHRVAETLVAADVALTGYPIERFGKSGAIMAYAMAGLPILTSEEDSGAQYADMGKFIHLSRLCELEATVSDERARHARQKRAVETIGWPVLATRALSILERSIHTSAE